MGDRASTNCIGTTQAFNDVSEQTVALPQTKPCRYYDFADNDRYTEYYQRFIWKKNAMKTDFSNREGTSKKRKEESRLF